MHRATVSASGTTPAPTASAMTPVSVGSLPARWRDVSPRRCAKTRRPAPASHITVTPGWWRMFVEARSPLSSASQKRMDREYQSMARETGWIARGRSASRKMRAGGPQSSSRRRQPAVPAEALSAACSVSRGEGAEGGSTLIANAILPPPMEGRKADPRASSPSDALRRPGRRAGRRLRAKRSSVGRGCVAGHTALQQAVMW